jgi:hypothetical protein
MTAPRCSAGTGERNRSPAVSPLAFATAPSPRWERIATALLLLLFVIVGINNIQNRAFEGQDYGFHVTSTLRLVYQPEAWFAQDLTNRPLIYWIAVDGFHLTGGRAPFAFAAGVFLLLNTGALWLLHDSSRRFITLPALRIAALTLIAFWPATTIGTVVFAADAMAQPPFALLCWGLLRWSESATDRHSVTFAGLAGVGLAIGNFAKFTFIFLPAGVLVLAFLAWRWQHATTRRALILVALAVLMPTAVGAWLQHQSSAAVEHKSAHHTFSWAGTGEMTWRSLLGVKWSDARVFNAPGYWDPEFINGKRYLPLLRENDYSYPALLHLGTFSDVLDFSHGGSQLSGRPRPEPQKSFSQWAVRLGVLFSIPGVIAIVLFSARIVRSAARPDRPPRFGATIWLVLGLNWFVPLVVILPFVHHAYQWGYWLPRLVIPALWSFGLCLFTWMDELVGHRPSLGMAIAILTTFQAALQILSVWY